MVIVFSFGGVCTLKCVRGRKCARVWVCECVSCTASLGCSAGLACWFSLLQQNEWGCRQNVLGTLPPRTMNCVNWKGMWNQNDEVVTYIHSRSPVWWIIFHISAETFLISIWKYASVQPMTKNSNSSSSWKWLFSAFFHLLERLQVLLIMDFYLHFWCTYIFDVAKRKEKVYCESIVHHEEGSLLWRGWTAVLYCAQRQCMNCRTLRVKALIAIH